MRLIDADALNEMKFKGVGFITIPGVKEYQSGWNYAVDTIIETAPTIEAKYGHWSKKHNGLRRCSVCKNEVEVIEWRNMPLYKYCPYCGAKMSEEDL